MGKQGVCAAASGLLCTGSIRQACSDSYKVGAQWHSNGSLKEELKAPTLHYGAKLNSAYMARAGPDTSGEDEAALHWHALPAQVSFPKMSVYRLPFFFDLAPGGGPLLSGASLTSSVTTLLLSRASSTFPAPWLPFTPSCKVYNIFSSLDLTAKPP